MNLLFPFSVTIATVVVVILWQRAAQADAFNATGLTFIAVLLMLAIIEHWFLVLPLPTAALWNWSLRARQERHAVSHARLAAKLRRRPSLTGAIPMFAPVAIVISNDKTIGGEP